MTTLETQYANDPVPGNTEAPQDEPTQAEILLEILLASGDDPDAD